ncbi:MAG: hypothetical protein ACI3W8_04770 [Oscillospiraceae bacterium]
MSNALKTSLWFYTGADYLIINAFLWKNKSALDECLEIVWNNNRGILREAEEQTPERRFCSAGIDAMELYESYRRRTPELLSDTAKNAMLGQAVEDIYRICRAMRPTPREMRLIRNVDKRFAVKDFRIGDTVDLLGLTSTSTTGQLIDYGRENYRKPDQILELHVAVGLPVLPLEDNGENEVILPPMAYRAVGRRDENGVDVVTMEAIRPLDLERLIREAKLVCMK